MCLNSDSLADMADTQEAPRTSYNFQLDQEVMGELRSIKAVMGREDGRAVYFREVIARLVQTWWESRPGNTGRAA